MQEHPNTELLRDGFAAFAKGDLDHIRDEMFADGIIWHFPGRNRLSGDYQGKDQVIRLFLRLFEETGGTFAAEPYQIMSNEDYAVALVRLRGERGGKRLDLTGVNVFRQVNGKTVEAWVYSDDQYAADEFWA
ncbi:nuclear transport factor 2 family protein [Planobispora longispora]|uniref:SnoaL-like domain-containing protein n=1 Tax=Planobispora longispora TaxID=28887 RepID=A0A8J3RKZ3_9ACTN|nr:nuclear transport factor 2 family protein [Planobispora longispora]GIH75534.1 hypothetical protein Plo01_19630 [Planobispora longispora]